MPLAKDRRFWRRGGLRDRAGYGKSFRLPTINALFWKGDVRSHGNPGLKPEKSNHSDVAGEINLGLGVFNLSAGLTYFHSYIRDLVVWQPDYQGVWRPVNLASARITGHEDNISLGFFEDKFEIIYQNTVTTALNKVPGHNSYNKKLTFYPGYITSITSRLNLGWLSAAYSIRFVDKAYTNQANTRFYDSYSLDDFRIGTDINISKYWRFSADAKIDNVRNVDYVLMTHYPMPRPGPVDIIEGFQPVKSCSIVGRIARSASPRWLIRFFCSGSISAVVISCSGTKKCGS